MRSLRTVSVVFAIALVPVAMADDPPSLTGLGDLPGGAFHSRAIDISPDGSVVVGVSYVESGTTGDDGCCEAFRWTRAGGMIGLGDLADGGFESEANGASLGGTIVVGQGHTGVDRACRWVSETVLQQLPELPGGGIGGAGAYGVSDDGTVIVGTDVAEFGQEAFRLTGSKLLGLGDLPGGETRSFARGVSGDGETIVGWSVSGDGVEAFRWTTKTGEMIGLGELPGGTFYSEATATSDDGVIVVGWSEGKNGREAFVVDAAGVMHGLGDLDGGDFESRALTVSGDGRIVGGYATSALGREAVLWTDGAIHTVASRLAAAGVDLDGWLLGRVAGATADGRTLVGYGTNPMGATEGWIATFPCSSDLDGSGDVGLVDLLGVLAGWGPCDGCAEDLDGSGSVDFPDLLAVLAAWGGCP